MIGGFFFCGQTHICKNKNNAEYAQNKGQIPNDASHLIKCYQIIFCLWENPIFVIYLLPNFVCLFISIFLCVCKDKLNRYS